nr:MAG TPA: hypothetical protein [Caudoviricetes sp.]
MFRAIHYALGQRRVADGRYSGNSRQGEGTRHMKVGAASPSPCNSIPPLNDFSQNEKTKIRRTKNQKFTFCETS